MKKILYIIMVFTAMIFINGCEGPEGEVGPQGFKGSDGETGVAGEDGVDGVDGEDGFSIFDYEESISSGSIKFVVEGTLQGDINVKDSIEYPFNPEFDEYNFKDNSWMEETYGGYYFYLNRKSTLLPYDIRSRMVSGERAELSFVERWGEFDFDEIYFRSTLLTEDSKSYTFYVPDLSPYVEDVTDYYFDSTKGILKLTIHVIVPGNMNITGNDLKVTIYVDAIVFGDDYYYGPK